jgi:SPX domain protein involved in polyphosphate accumulation
MVKPATELAGHRYERKFAVPPELGSNVLAQIRHNPGLFSSIYHPRTVNNLYLDTAGLDLYFMNLEGAAERMKVRIRWYGELFGEIARPVLEFKIKRGLLGRKESFALKPFRLDVSFSSTQLEQTLKDCDLPAHVRHRLSHLHPALVNRYQRAYYQSADTNYRMTLDTQLEFFRVRPAHNSFLCRASRFRDAVLELKFDHSCWEGAANIANALPFRVSRMSKYISGLDRLEGF